MLKPNGSQRPESSQLSCHTSNQYLAENSHHLRLWQDKLPVGANISTFRLCPVLLVPKRPIDYLKYPFHIGFYLSHVISQRSKADNKTFQPNIGNEMIDFFLTAVYIEAVN
jgi:hypothetical protein